MDTTTVLCGLLAALAALPALDAILRQRRLATPRGDARPVERARAPQRLLAVIPSRAEGARVGDIAGDLKKEGSIPFRVDVLVVLDGPDPDAEARLTRDAVHYLSKKSPGPAKGQALAFLAERMGPGMDSYDFILVFDADMRLPEGFFRDLAVPPGTEAFQLPVRPAGVPAPGAPRVEAFSLAAARADDLARDAEGLPVRLRGKAMGFSPDAFRLGPAVSTRTTAEDSEATLRLSASGIRVRALAGPFAFDEPAPAPEAMARARARWFGGHLKLLVTGFFDLLKIAAKSPKGAFVLAADLWLRPRVFVLLALALLAIVSDVAMVVFSSSGAWRVLFLLLLSLEAKTTLVFEWLSVAALRRNIGYPSEVPAVTFSDLHSSLAMWAGAVGRALVSPSRWHRARPPA